MTVTVSTQGATTFVHMTGDFDFSSQDELNAAFQSALNATPQEVEVDMETTTFIDSGIIRLFLKLHEACRQRQKTFRIRNCSAHLFEIFAIGGFDTVFDVRGKESG